MIAIIRNFTPHKVTIVGIGSYDPEPAAARCAVESKPSEPVYSGLSEIPVHTERFGAAEGLPVAVPGVTLIVSRIVAERSPGRTDLVWPGDVVRDAQGRPVGCRVLCRTEAAHHILADRARRETAQQATEDRANYRNERVPLDEREASIHERMLAEEAEAQALTNGVVGAGFGFTT